MEEDKTTCKDQMRFKDVKKVEKWSSSLNLSSEQLDSFNLKNMIFEDDVISQETTDSSSLIPRASWKAPPALASGYVFIWDL